MFRQEILNIIKFTAVFVLILLLSVSVAFADDEAVDPEMGLKASGSEDVITLKANNVDGTPYFFLPSGVKDENIEYAPGEDVLFETMQSANIASIHFFSSDPDKDMSYVHESKDNKAPGNVIIYDENFEQIYKGKVDAFKGRGNTTWSITDKKSYQIKLDKKADLLDPVNGDQKAKKWILLANPFDPTLIRNYMAYNVGKELGLDCCTEGRPIDFYYDGEYRGSYYLCEKVEIGDGRVEINELEKDVEKANPDVDFDDLEVVTGTNSRGSEIRYEEGITDPEDISGGYLMEFDSVYYKDEKSWFQVIRGSRAVIKSPEYNSRSMVEYISDAVTDAFLYTERTRAGIEDGSKLQDYIDIDSFARFILVNEWLVNNDTWYSSTFFYKPEGEDRIYAGPVWDFDSSLRIQSEERDYDKWYSKGLGLGGNLIEIPIFRQRMKEIYETEMRPIIFNTLLGTEEREYVKPYEAMKEELAASAAMNYMLWDIDDCLGLYFPEDTIEKNYAVDLEWMKNRAEWFDKEIMRDDFAPKFKRIYGDTRYETSLKAADAYKAQLGVDKFNSVILACGSNYADALAGSYLSSVKNAPILLVSARQDHIDAVQAFIKKNLAEGGTIYQLGGEAVVPDAAAAGLSGYEIKRLWGADRYATNVAILEEAGVTGDEILVASGTGFADSLSASATGRPILLVKDTIQDSQKDYVASLKGKKFFVIGGSGAVNDDLEAYFKDLGETTRLGGLTRYETSVSVANQFFPEPKGAVLAYGVNFPDGLCGGSLANAMGGPLLLAANGKADQAAAYAKEKGIKDGAVLGGPALIDDKNASIVFS